MTMCSMTETAFVILLVTLSLATSKDVSFTFELPDHAHMCFYEEYTDHQTHLFEFDVVKGGHHDVDVTVEHDGKEVYRRHKIRKDTVRLEPKNGGPYKFCFSNEFSTITHKVIFFELRNDEVDTLAKEAKSRKKTAKTLVEESMDSIHRASTQIAESQTLYRLREASGKEFAQELNNRVFWRSVIQSCVIVLSGISQVLILKTFFTDTAPPRRNNVSQKL